MPSPTSHRLILAFGVIGLAVAHPAPSAAYALMFPSTGVLCDPGASICYDQRGASIALTQTYLGAMAAQRLSRSLGGGAPSQQFRLSNGASCSLSDRRCWSDGWSRRQVDTELSNRLFSASAAGSSSAREVGYCTLSEGGATLFNGACGLRQISRQGATRYMVSLNDGKTYSFSNRSGRFLLNDSGGTWPVSIANQGGTGLFRWRDVQLTATRVDNNGLTDNGGDLYNDAGIYNSGNYNSGGYNSDGYNSDGYNSDAYNSGAGVGGPYSNGSDNGGFFNGGGLNGGGLNGNGLNPGFGGLLNLIQSLFR